MGEYRGARISIWYIDGDKPKVEDVQVLPPDLTIIEAIIAGKWKCEECVDHNHCSIENVIEEISDERIPCAEWKPRILDTRQKAQDLHT